MENELIERAQRHIQQAGLIVPDTLSAFKNGITLCSIEPNSSLVCATKEQQEMIAMLEAKGTGKVWHIISGTYRMSDGDKLEMETYLIAIKELLDLEPWNDGGFLSHAYINNLSWDEAEYGDVVIAPNHGGLKRVA